MFGINDTKDQNANANAYSGGVATQPMEEYQNPGAGHSASTGGNMPGYDTASTTPPAPDPLSIPSAPPMSDTASNTVPLTPPLAQTPEPATPSPEPTLHPSGAMVSLEHAYIQTDSPHMTNQPTTESPKPSAASLFTANTDDLVKMKQQALQHLEPLVDKLDQTPEEKFKTTMMLIQASDNSDLLKEAYEAANAIKDEKARAHALLDVVNEINYFTQQAQAGTNPQPQADAGQIL
jgi:hypothetical protein